MDLYTCTIVRISAASTCKDTESQACENMRAEMHEPETCREKKSRFFRVMLQNHPHFLF